MHCFMNLSKFENLEFEISIEPIMTHYVDFSVVLLYFDFM